MWGGCPVEDAGGHVGELSTVWVGGEGVRFRIGDAVALGTGTGSTVGGLVASEADGLGDVFPGDVFVWTTVINGRAIACCEGPSSTTR